MRLISHTINPKANDEPILDENQNEEEWSKDVPTIPEFYAGREIFVTGGSGFMGKVLLEKLLRSCPDLKCIYVLLRPKKGRSVDERLQEIVNLPLFSLLKKVNSGALRKIIPIAGDVSELKLGMSNEDQRRLRNVSVIFHSAASVRFDDTLKDAVFMNTRGTREVLKFAKTLRDVKAVQHVSTTYSHPELKFVGEKIHEPYVDWKKAIQICENLNEEVLDIATPKYMQFMPNTYTFTKALAEQIVDDHKDELPLMIFRPSIVISSMKEPFPGWIDNFNGPVGLLVGSGIGITRTMHCDPDNIADFTPVDICIKAMIIAAWKRAHQPRGALPIYNCCTSNQRSVTMEQIIDMGKEIQHEAPMEKVLWLPGGGLTRWRLINYIRVIFLHLLPAFLIDAGLKLKGEKPFIVNLQRKIYQANLALNHFILNNWDFENKSFMQLSNELKLQDLKAFYFNDFLDYDLILYFRHAVFGARRYLMKEKDETIEKCRRKNVWLYYLDAFVRILFYGAFFYFIFIKYNFLCISSIFCSFLGSSKC